MSQIAVNVVLLLPDEVDKLCRKINTDKDAEQHCNLGDPKLHPHITLAMGVIDDYHIDKINAIIAEVLKRYSKFKLTISKTYAQTMPDKRITSGFSVDMTMELVKLHAELLDEISHFFSYHVREYMFDCLFGEKINNVSMIWLEDYGTKHKTPANFRPHISLNCKNIAYNKFPIKFAASSVALCLLGDYCTSKTILSTFNLKE
jgi:hypothetical protein